MGHHLFRLAKESEDLTVRLTSMFGCAHQLASLSPKYKDLLGAIGFQNVMAIITEHIQTETVDEGSISLLEGCWTFLWNVTDETPSNVHRFIDMNGLHLIESMFEVHADEGGHEKGHIGGGSALGAQKRARLKRTVTGLLTNIAEVPAGRRHMMAPHLLALLRTTLADVSGDVCSLNVFMILTHPQTLAGRNGNGVQFLGDTSAPPRRGRKVLE
jgi:hypothetical protein